MFGRKINKKEMKNEVKNGYCETPRKKNEQKELQNAFYEW
jgi:hypothetical protein